MMMNFSLVPTPVGLNQCLCFALIFCEKYLQFCPNINDDLQIFVQYFQSLLWKLSSDNLVVYRQAMAGKYIQQTCPWDLTESNRKDFINKKITLWFSTAGIMILMILQKISLSHCRGACPTWTLWSRCSQPSPCMAMAPQQGDLSPQRTCQD